ncbi:MAG: replication initiator, partial [Lacisediminihabitans sp.]
MDEHRQETGRSSERARPSAEQRLVSEIVRRVSSGGYETWWTKVAGAGYCAAPIQLSRTNDGAESTVLVRCKNRRQAVCPSCSDLYAGDTWHLVHAGIGGGDDVPVSVALHPLVFVTLTAPSFGAVHRATDSDLRCRASEGSAVCRHGRPTGCVSAHDSRDALVGQALCIDCYRYIDQAVFTWHAPELWSRFTLTLRRILRRHLAERDLDPASVKVSFVKVVEMQRRGVPHFHAIIRLDQSKPSDPQECVHAPSSVDARTLVDITREAILATHVDVFAKGGEEVRLRFGVQFDVQSLSMDSAHFREISDGNLLARRVAGYLAKYVTKSVVDFGLSPRRIGPAAIEHLDITEHVRHLLRSIVEISAEPGHERILDSLHTLGYRGHVTTKSRRYSTTMFALRAKRSLYL